MEFLPSLLDAPVEEKVEEGRPLGQQLLKTVEGAAEQAGKFDNYQPVRGDYD